MWIEFPPKICVDKNNSKFFWFGKDTLKKHGEQHTKYIPDFDRFIREKKNDIAV